MSKRKNSRVSLKRISITRISLSNLIMLTVVFIATGFVIFNYIIETIANSRQMNLQQAGYSLNVIQNAVDGMSNTVLDLLSDITYSQDSKEDKYEKLTSDELNEIILPYTTLMDNLGFEMSIDIVTIDGKQYSSNPLYKSALKSFISSSWFIDMAYTNKNDNIWGMRTIDPMKSDIIVLSYSRVIYDKDGSVLGILITNINHSTLYDTYSNLIAPNNSNTVQIINSNGTVISHKNQSLIGFKLYDINYIHTQMPYNSSKIVTNEKPELITTYFEPNSGWILIERIPLNEILQPLQPLVIMLLIIICCSFILSVLVGIGISKSITKRLLALSAHMRDFHSEQSTKADFPILDSDCSELYTLGTGFNEMMRSIEKLIEDIKVGEIERKQIEFNFLQAQINPHFLHNTLLSVKALIFLNRREDAIKMLEAFIGLVKTPINVEKPLIELEREISGIKSYICIMEYRYNTQFLLSESIPAELYSFEIPQMTLQPIIENCIFHGFSDQSNSNTKLISISVQAADNAVSITISDNGKGMTSEQLANIWSPKSNSHSSFNHISMINILKRLRWIYGENANIIINSEENKGTDVIIFIPANTSQLNEAEGIDNENHIS